MTWLTMAALVTGPLFLGAGRLLGLGGAVAGVVGLLPLSVGLVVYTAVANRGVLRIARPSWWLTAGTPFLVLLLASVARTGNPEYQGIQRMMLAAFWIAVMLFGIALFSDAAVRPAWVRQRLYAGLLLAPGTLVLANVLLFGVGVKSPEAVYNWSEQSRMASWFGVETERVVFPLARAANNFGVVAGSGLAASLACLLYAARGFVWRSYAMVLSAACLVALVLCDSRAALFFGVVSALLVAVMAKLNRVRAVRWLVFAAPVLPLVLLSLLSALAHAGLGGAISRTPGDLESATGRVFIWAAGVAELLHPRLVHLVGWGQYGQLASGVSLAWADRFTNLVGDATTASLHNMSLQLVFDMGYLGYTSALVAFWWLIGAFAAHGEGERAALGLVAVLVYYLLIGTTEPSVSLVFPDNILMIMLMLTAACAYGSRQGAGSAERAAPR